MLPVRVLQLFLVLLDNPLQLFERKLADLSETLKVFLALALVLRLQVDHKVIGVRLLLAVLLALPPLLLSLLLQLVGDDVVQLVVHI